MRAWPLLAGFALLAVLTLGWVGTARAQDAVATGATGAAGCPETPIVYEGEDVVRGELRELRRDLAATCAELGGRVEDAGRVVADAVEAIPGRSADDRLFVQSEPNATAPTGPTGTQEVRLVDAQRDEISAGGEQLRYALWFAIGAGLLAMTAPLVLRGWGVLR